MRGKLFLAMVMSILVAGCYAGPEPAHFAAVLDELSVPAGWQLVYTTIREPGGERECDPSVQPDCASVTRFFLVDGEPVDAFPGAKQMLVDAGFEVEEEVAPACDLRPKGIACWLRAFLEGDRVTVFLFTPGFEAEGLGLAQAGQSLIMVAADRKL